MSFTSSTSATQYCRCSLGWIAKGNGIGWKPNNHNGFLSDSPTQFVMDLPRGGGPAVSEDDEDDDEEEDDDDEEEEEEEVEDDDGDSLVLEVDNTQQILEEILAVSQNAALTTIRFMARTIRFAGRALQRSLVAGLSEEPPEDSNLPTLARIGKCLERMITALLDFSTFSPSVLSVSTGSQIENRRRSRNQQDAEPNGKDDEEEEEDANGKTEPVRTIPQKASVDFGDYLQKAYKLPESSISRNTLDHPCIIHTGSFSDALTTARRHARLLLVLITSKGPNTKKRNNKNNNNNGKDSAAGSSDLAALTSFLSKDVSQMANRRARKSGPKPEAGSFVLWSALPGSPEAALAMKRLQLSLTNSHGSQRPIVAVVYAAKAVDPRTGRPRMAPKLLAQHHASPPPSADMMAAWMNALRKRHAARYVQMQKDVQEVEWYKERKEGYQSSAKLDLERQQREKQLAAEAKALEEREKKQRAALLKRRLQLEEQLPEEPESSSSSEIKTVALRLSSSSSSKSGQGSSKPQQRLQRRFLSDTPLSTVFNWVDVALEMERETIVLTTLNGRNIYSWKDVQPKGGDGGDTTTTATLTLANVGPSKMVGFWVKQRQEQDENKGNAKKGSEEEEKEDGNSKKEASSRKQRSP